MADKTRGKDEKKTIPVDDKNKKTEDNNEINDQNNNKDIKTGKSKTNETCDDEAKTIDKDEESYGECDEECNEENTYLKEIMNLKIELSKKGEESQKYLDMARRMQAEFDNFRKRTQKEKEDLIKNGNEDIILEMIPILDNLERAMQASNTGKENTNDAKSSIKAITDGINMVINQFRQVLKKFGVKEVEALGKDFDPFYHHAVMQEEKEGEKPNTIIEVYQKGYLLNDKVIRPSMVKVAK